MKILVMSGTPWNDNNSFGNSYSNIFKGIDGIEFANISFGRYLEQTDSEIVSKSFQVTTKMLVKNLLKKSCKVGVEGYISPEESTAQNIEQTSALKFAKKRRWQILFWVNDLLWKIGRWKTPELDKFIDDFNPDLIFQPVYYGAHMNRLVRYVKKRTGVPMLGYISDDCYTLKRFSLSPLFWIDRLIKRRGVKRTIESCEILYVISEIQRQEYEKLFTPPCKILTKCEDFSADAPDWELSKDKIKMVYAGNIGKGRGKSLELISEAVEKLNQEGIEVEFDIYTRSPLDENIFNHVGTKLCGASSYAEIFKIQKNADIMVHAEGLSLKDRLEVHQSFSTKLVDFFKLGKCIFAVGSYDQAFAKHLIDNDAAVVADSKEKVYIKLKELLNNPQSIIDYGKKAYECGKKNHSKESIQQMLRDDLINTANIVKGIKKECKT